MLQGIIYNKKQLSSDNWRSNSTTVYYNLVIQIKHDHDKNNITNPKNRSGAIAFLQDNFWRSWQVLNSMSCFMDVRLQLGWVGLDFLVNVGTLFHVFSSSSDGPIYIYIAPTDLSTWPTYSQILSCFRQHCRIHLDPVGYDVCL